jgi:hypothetical protein
MFVNIAVGSATVVTSARNLIINSKMEDKKNAVGLYSYSRLNNEMNLVLGFARKLQHHHL